VIPAEVLPVSKLISVVITTIESLGKREVIKWVLPLTMAERTTVIFQIPHNGAADGSLSQVESARLVQYKCQCAADVDNRKGLGCFPFLAFSLHWYTLLLELDSA